MAVGADILVEVRVEHGAEFRQVQVAVDTAELVIGFEPTTKESGEKEYYHIAAGRRPTCTSEAEHAMLPKWLPP